MALKYLIILKSLLLGTYGIHSGKSFYKWIRERLAEKEVVKFKDLKLPLKIIASDITNKKMLVFDSEIHKDVEVAKAVRMSMGIPFFFQAYKWVDSDLSGRKSLVVDGGLLSNYPVHIFDDSKRPTIGFKLIGSDEDQPPEPISNVLAYAKSILDTMMVAHEKIHIKEADWARTIPIPTGDIKITQFDLIKSQKDWLYNSGYEAAGEFFNKKEG
jgi:NTE family protein